MNVQKKILFSLIAMALPFVIMEGCCRVIESATIRGKVVSIKPKAKEEFRVFLYGGSSMYGYPVPEVGFIAQLKFWLGKYYPRRKIKLYNFAKPGNSSYTVWLKIKRTILYKPDLLIVYSGHNEFLLRSTKGISSRLNYLVERSSLSTVRVFRYAWQRFLLWKNRQVYLTEKRTPFAYKSPEYLHKKNL